MGTDPPDELPPDERLLDDGDVGPTVPRLVLGTRLRRYREARGITRDVAGEEIRSSQSKISRLELGRTGFKPRDVADLLTLYGVTDETRRAPLLALARRANAPGWWNPYGELIPGWFEAYLGLEQAASVIRNFEVQYVPGLLQTPDYARAVIGLGLGEVRSTEIDRRVELRTRRQRILERSRPPYLWAVIDEAALRRPIGGPATMRAQVRHLMEINKLGNVTIQIVPFRIGGHAAGGPISLLRLPEKELPDVIYLEQPTNAHYPDKPQEIDYYRHILNRLVTQADPAADTESGLQRILAET